MPDAGVTTMNRERKHFFDEHRNLERVLRIFYALCAGLLLLDLVYHRHATLGWEDHFGFYAIFGFVSCVVLVLVAKQLRKILMRGEDYYGHR